MTTVHVVGAGIAGLSCAVRLAHSGIAVTVYEGAGAAGGRCRSFPDPRLGRIDTGTHLFVGANEGVFSYLRDIGNPEGLRSAGAAAFPFIDIDSGERWCLRPNGGPLPWWVLVRRRRVPNSRAGDYLAAAGLRRAPAGATVADCLGRNRLYRSLWTPLCEAVLNTAPEEASARLLGDVLDATILKGEAMCRPYFCAGDLGSALVDPAILMLARLGAKIRFNDPLRSLSVDGRITALHFASGTVSIGPEDRIVLAVPWWAAERLSPGLVPELPGRAIVNAHFRLEAPLDLSLPFVGVIGGAAQWVFLSERLVSVTVSAAETVAKNPGPVIAERLWRDACATLGLPIRPTPPFRIVKERRATLAHTPAVLASRPAAVTPIPNLILAGDWTDTGLPCTVEGAVRSGHVAAEHCRAAGCRT